MVTVSVCPFNEVFPTICCAPTVPYRIHENNSAPVADDVNNELSIRKLCEIVQVNDNIASTKYLSFSRFQLLLQHLEISWENTHLQKKRDSLRQNRLCIGKVCAYARERQWTTIYRKELGNVESNDQFEQFQQLIQANTMEAQP